MDVYVNGQMGLNGKRLVYFVNEKDEPLSIALGPGVSVHGNGSVHEIRLAHGCSTYLEVDPQNCFSGFTLFFTGLSGAGKSTIAERLRLEILKRGRPVTFLDGDQVRTHLSKGLGFSKEDRDANIERIAFVAGEAVRHGGIAIACPIAPYEDTRRKIRSLIRAHGRFILVYISTPLSECEKRDPKGLYSKARKGQIKSFTGVSDPYEAPQDADIVIDTTDASVESCVERIVHFLEKELLLPHTFGVPQLTSSPGSGK